MKELMRRYWEPELIIDELFNESSVVKIEATITLPPNSPTEKILELLRSKFHQYQPTLISTDPGFLCENPRWLSKTLTEFFKSYSEDETEWVPVCDFRQYFGVINVPSRDMRQQYLYLSKPHASSVLAEVLNRSVTA